MSPLSGVVPSHFNPSEPKVLDSDKLYRACETGNIKEVERLTQDFEEIPNENGSEGMSPLHIACQKGFPDIVRLLIAKKVDVSFRSNDDYTPLHYACKFGHEQVVQELINAGGNVEERSGLCAVTPLHQAIAFSHLGVASLLIKNNADVNAVTNDGESSLSGACIVGRQEMVRMLIEAGANIDAKNGPNELTALHAAACNGHVGVIGLLISEKADVHVSSKDGFTPLYLACQEGHEGAAQALIKAGARIEEKNGSRECTALFVAAERGHVGVIRLLLSKNANINVTSKNGFTPLYLACEKGHEWTARALIEAGANIEEKNGPDKWTALIAAANNGHVGAIRLLRSNNADVHARSKSGCTPLYYACGKGHEGAAQALIKAGARIEEKNGPDEWTALFAAAANGHIDVIGMLISEKADINTRSKSGHTPLYLACQNGHKWAARALIEAGANIEEKNGPHDWTALFAAANDGHVGVIRLLQSNNANVNTRSKNGFTPFYYACQNGHEGAAQALIEAGANIEEKNGLEEWTALRKAAANGHVGVIRLLLSKNANINVSSKNGFTPFYFACQGGHEEAARLFLEAGVKIEEKNGPYEGTALDAAADNGHVSVIGLLLSKKAEVNTRTKDGFTPFYGACQNGHEEVARLLLDAGANLEEKNGSHECTAFFAAAKYGHIGVIRLLLSKNADVNTRTKNGCTPFFVACQCGHEEVVRELVAAGAVIDERLPVTNRTALQYATLNMDEKIVALLLELGATVYKTDGMISQAVQDAYFTHQQAELVRGVSVLESGLEIEDEHMQLFLKTVSAQVVLRQMFSKAPSEELSEKIESMVSTIQKNEITKALSALDTPTDDPHKAILTILKTLSVQKIIFDQPEPNSLTIPDCIALLSSRKFEELIDSEVKVLKEALAATKSSDEIVKIKEKCKKIVAHLHDVKSLHAKVFQEAFRADFCKRINMKIAQFQAVQESCASKEKTDPAEEFDSADIFALLADRFGVGTPAQVDSVGIRPTESIMSILQCDFSDLYKAGLCEGRDLRILGIDEQGANLERMQEILQDKNLDDVSQIPLTIIRTFLATKKDIVAKLLTDEGVTSLADLYKKKAGGVEPLKWAFSLTSLLHNSVSAKNR